MSFDINKLVMESVMDLQNEAAPGAPGMEDAAKRAQAIKDADAKEAMDPRNLHANLGDDTRSLQDRAATSVAAHGRRAAEFAKEHGGKAALVGAGLAAGAGGLALARRLRAKRAGK